MHKLTVKITGIHNHFQFDEITSIVGRNVYQKGTDEALFVDLDRETADLAMAQINSTPGLHAESIRWM